MEQIRKFLRDKGFALALLACLVAAAAAGVWAVRTVRDELDKISHRVYDTGFYFGQPKVCGEAVGVTQEAEYMGYVLDVSGGEALVEMKNRFFVGDELETVTPKGSEKLVIEDIVLERTGEHVGVVNVPMERVRIPCGGKLAAGDMLRGPGRNRA